MIHLVALSTVPADAIETLLDQTFGAGRHTRTAYAVRAGVAPIGDLSFAAIADNRLTGSLQSWPVTLEKPRGDRLPLVMVGPVAVHPDYQNRGIGKHMTRVVAQRLDTARQSAMMIGDPDYYEQFGFLPGPAAKWILPGPVEPRRILLRAIAETGWPVHGKLGPDLLRSDEALPN